MNNRILKFQHFSLHFLIIVILLIVGCSNTTNQVKIDQNQLRPTNQVKSQQNQLRQDSVYKNIDLSLPPSLYLDEDEFGIDALVGAMIMLGTAVGAAAANTQDQGSTKKFYYHVWAFLITELGNEDPGYGMYTYVLFGRNLRFPFDTSSKTFKRYIRLLDAVVHSTLSNEDKHKLPEKACNIFYVPGVKDRKNNEESFFQFSSNLHLRNLATNKGVDYNFNMAMHYLTLIPNAVLETKQKLAEQFITKPGPFLVSTLKPIGKIIDSQSHLLFADLSDTNHAAMDEIVTAYKQRINLKPVNDIERFKTLRLQLLNLVLNADDNVKLLKLSLATLLHK